MKFGINDLDDFNLFGKTVLCRVDMNQPVDKKTDTLNSTHRIEACAPTLKEISDKGAKLVVMCHQGSDIEYQNFYNTKPHAKVLENLLGKKIKWTEDVCGPTAKQEIKNLKDCEILLLNNVRYQAEEMTLFEKALKLSHEEQAQTQVVQELAPLADLYVCDAFAAAHRDQPTLCGFEQLLPSAMGRLFEKEYVVISKLMEEPERPCVYILGGAKISDAFIMLENASADTILTGGLVGNIMLAAKGENIGQASLDFIEKQGYTEFIDKAKILLDKYEDKIVTPIDLCMIEGSALDIGPKTIEKYKSIILNAKTVFVNGPMGVFEKEDTESGTKEIFQALGKNAVVGGGDSVTAAKKYGMTEKLGYVCTGGGALIRFLTGKELPVVKALRYSTKKFGADK